jgi:pantetheine-phosphate adenylyltransferase
MSIAIYAGSFDPVTEGHLSVVRAAAKLFGHVVVLVAVNPKKRTLLSLEERVELLRRVLRDYPSVSAAGTEGLVVDYARRIGASVLLRGVRSATDAQYETELAQANRSRAPELATLFVPAEADLSEVSSSKLKELALRGEDISRYCPPEVAELLRSRLQTPTEPAPGADFCVG